MNKTTTHFLLLSICVLTCSYIYGQRISGIRTESWPSNLVCAGNTAKIDADITEPRTSYQSYSYQYWDGESWACCFGTDQKPYELPIPATGQLVEVQRKYTQGQTVYKTESVGFFYTPLTPSVRFQSTQATTCTANDGSISVSDISANFTNMARRFYLYDAQGTEIGYSDVKFQASYTFGNLAPGTYKVIISTGCTEAEQSVVLSGTNPAAKIDGPTSLCLGTGTELVAIGGDSYLWSTGSTSSSITVLPSTPGLHTYSVQVKKGTCSQNAELNITVTPGPTASILGPDKACYNGSITLSASGTGTYKWSTGATTSSISLSLLQSNQTYGLTITDPVTKCSSVDEHVVNVLPKPTLNDTPNSICAGASVNLSVSGGSSYSWNVGGSTASIVHSPSEFTEYRVTVTDANGCVYSLSKSVNVEALPRITFGGGTSICAGQSLNVTAFGGQSYRWDYNNATTATITVSPTQNTTYTVTATSAGGCTSSAQRVIQVKTPATGAIVGASSICPGQSLTLTASGVGTYRWSENNATTSSIQVSPSQNTTYSLLITNAEGCTFQTSHSVSVNITGSASNDGPLTCSKTTALLQSNTGAAGASFSWRNASGVEIASSPTTSVNTPGVYNLVITGAGGCSYTAATEVLVNRVNPSMTLSQNGPITCTKPNVVLSAIPGTPGASYAWQWRNSAGTVLATAASVGVSQPGLYTLRATDTNGCTAEQSLSVGADVAPPVLSTVSNDGPLSCTKTSVVLSASSSTPGVTFTWKNAGGTPLGYNASTSVSTAGTYVVEVQGSNGCKLSQSTVVGQTGTFPHISVNQPAPISCTNAQTWVSGGSNTAGVTYEWRNANNRVVATQSGFNAQMPGEYTLKVTAPNGCSSSSMVMVEDEVWVAFDWLVDGKTINFWENANYQIRSITCSKSSVSVGLPGSNSSNGTFVLITPQGSSLNMYPGNTRTLTLPGAYRLEMTQSGCTRRKELLIVEDRTPPVVKIEGTTELCGSGSTTLLASGGNKYKWNTGATTASLALGTLTSTSSYTVTVTGLNGCTASKPATVSIHPIPQATPLHAGTFCLDAGQLAGGTLAVNASGGTAPYSYRWDNGQSTAGVSVSSPSSLSMGVTVTDSKGCFTTTSASLVVNRRPYAQILGGEMACAGESPTLTASGGSNYLWSNNATTSSIAISKPTQNQTYSVTVSNVPGCVGVASKTVVVPAALSVGHTLAGTDDCIANNAQVIPSLSGGTGNITLSLFRSGEVEPLPSLNGLKSGTYLLKAQDSKGCTAQREVVIQETPVFHLNLSISGDTLDCLQSNVQVSLSSTGARGSVSYHFDSPQNAILAPASFSSSTLRRWVYAVDTAGCVDSVEVLVRDSIVTDLIDDYTLAFDRDCIDGNAAITLQLSSAGATLPLSFQLNRETPTAQFHFDSLRAGNYLIRARYQDCRDSVAVLVDERIPRITGFQYLHQDDCIPNNTGVKLQAISGWGTLRYQVDTRVPQDSSRFDSLAAVSHRFLIIDSLQCRDSLLIPISSEQPAYISVEDLVKCDSASGRISFRPNTLGVVAAEYSIDGGKHWQTEVVFDSLPPGIYQPLRRKPSTGCIDSLNAVVLGRHCDTIPEAYFLQDTIRITEPNTSVLIRWEAKAPKWYRDTFYVKMKLEGDGFPHFNDGSRANARTPELRGGDPLDGPNVYRYIGGGTHRDSFYLPMQDSAHLYTYPADYYFTLSTPPGGKTLVDPDRDITRVTVSLLGPDVTEEEVKVTLCKDCTTIGKDDVTGANCYYWPNFPNPGQKTQNVCSSGQFTRMALDENLVVIKKTVYTVKLSDLKVSIKEDFAVPRSCSPDDNFLEAVATSTAEGAITFKWSTGATTQRIKLRSDVSTYTVTVTQGDCEAQATYTQEVENTACELKKYFEDNGFFAIPISNLQKQPALNTPELRDDCPQPRGDANGKVKDFAGYTFQVNGGQVDPKSQLTQALNRFESVFGYSNGSGLITSNDEVCACPNYLKDKQAGFAAQGGLQFWYHIFKADPSCPEASCDMLFIKAKMPNGESYPAGDADVAFLGAGYGVATQDVGLQGSALLTALDDLCLDNFAAAKDPDMFELEPEEEEPEQVEELQAPCNQLGFHLEPVAVVAPTGQVMLAPKSSVWRFRRPGTEHFVDGALTGFTQVSITEGEESVAIRYDPDGIPINPCTPWFRIKLVRVKVGRRWIWGDRYEARTDPNQPNHLKGYFQVLGIQDKAFTFEVPPSPSAVKPLKIYTGKLDKAASTSQCGLKYTIYSNHLIYDPPKGFSTQPKGILIKTMAEAGLGIPKAEYTYRICREDLVKLASSVNLNNKLGTLEVFMWKPSNSLNPGLYYKIELNGKKAYVFVAEDPGVGRRYYQFNCALGIWEEIVDPELSAVLPKLKHLDALWEVFLKRTEIHTALGLVSFVPFVGNLAGIANGVLYVNEGQTGQGTFEIVVGVLGLGLDILEAGSLIRAGTAGGRGALVQSIWSVTCPSATPFRSEVELRSILGCNVEPVLGQAGAKAFNEAIGTAATTIGGDVLPKVEGLFNQFLKSDKGTEFLKWLHADQKLIPDVTKIITNAFGKLGFTVADFIKLSDDLIANPSLISKLASSSRNLEWWLKLLREGKNASRLSAKVYEQIAKLPDGILNDLIFYSDDSFKEFMDIADDALIAELVANPDLVKGLVSHKNAAYLTYFDDAVDYATEILETPAGAKLLEWLNYSRETGSFLSRMAEANTFARNILERFRSLFGYTVQGEVSFIVKYGGKEFRTRIDGITIIDDEFVAIECKMGGAVLSDNQEAFFNALKNGGEVIPVGRNAEEIFGLANINKNVRDKFASYWFKNETRIGL